MLLSSMDSLTQLYSLTMDVHARLRTDSHQDITGADWLLSYVYAWTTVDELLMHHWSFVSAFANAMGGSHIHLLEDCKWVYICYRSFQ